MYMKLERKEGSRSSESLQQAKLLKGVIDSKLESVQFFKVKQNPQITSLANISYTCT